MAPGIESASNAVLKSMGKNMSFAQIADGLERAHAAGLKNQGVFIFGDPAETYETAMETIDWWKAHPQYNIYATPVFCFPGSAVYKKAVAEGLIEDPLEYIENGCPPINLSKIPADRYEEIMRLLAEHNRDIIEAWPVFAYTSIDADPGRRMTHSFRAVCGCCGRESVFERTRLYDTQWLACRHCETRHQLPPLLDVAPNIQKNLAALLAEYGQVAFWGIGRGFKTLIKPEYLDLPGLHLLDTQPGGTFGPLRVEAPETIIKHSIKFAVIPPPSSPWYEDIIRELKKYGVTSYTDLHNLQWSHLPIY